MSIYVDPERVRVQNFLEQEGQELSSAPKWAERNSGKTFVVLVHNYSSSVAVILFNEEELELWSDPTDDRPKRFFSISTYKLYPVSDPHFRGLATEYGLD